MNQRPRRWRLLVDWNLQASLCAHGLLYGSLVIAAVVCGIFAPLLWSLAGAPADAVLEDQAIVMLYMHDRFWFLAVLCLVITALGSLKFSHRIAGPLVRYKRNLRLLAQGKLPAPLRTRRHDYLKEEVVCLNDAVAGVAERIDAIRDAQVAVAREVQAVLARTPRSLAAQLQPLQDAALRLERSLAAFSRHDPKDDVIAAEPARAIGDVVVVASGGGS